MTPSSCRQENRREKITRKGQALNNKEEEKKIWQRGGGKHPIPDESLKCEGPSWGRHEKKGSKYKLVRGGEGPG